MNASKVAAHPGQVHVPVEVGEVDAAEVKTSEVEASEVLGSDKPGIVLNGCERLGSSGTKHGEVVHTAITTLRRSRRGASRERRLTHRDSARAGLVPGRSRNGLTRASRYNRWRNMAVALRLHTCLAAEMGDGVLPELVAGSEVVHEFVCASEAFVAIAVVAVELRPGLCCDMAI